MPIREITVEALRDAIAKGEPIALLDVRNEGEHAFAHLEPSILCEFAPASREFGSGDRAPLVSSILIPLHELPARIDELDEQKSARVVVYCHHGIRSKSGAAILEAAGFRDVVSLAGGIEAWSTRIDPKVPRY